MTITGAWKDVVDTADWKLNDGCIWRIWAGRPFTATWTGQDTSDGIVVEVDQFPLTDNLGKWSRAFAEVNGKRFPLGAAGAGVSTFRFDITAVAAKGMNTLNLYSTDETNLLHGIQAIRIRGKP